MAKAQFKKWLGGLISAVVSGALGALGVATLDPGDFNTDHLWSVSKVAVMFAVVALLNYLKQHPTPDDDDDVVKSRLGL